MIMMATTFYVSYVGVPKNEWIFEPRPMGHFFSRYVNKKITIKPVYELPLVYILLQLFESFRDARFGFFI